MLAGRNMYRTRGIITRGLYISNPLFKWSKRVFYGAFFVKFCRYVLLVFKSGLKWRAYGIYFSYHQLFVSKLMHWQVIGNSLPKWAVSDTVKIPYITLHLNKHCLYVRTTHKADKEESRNIWSEWMPARRWDKELFNNKMSFFFDFCFVAFLLWLVIFVASLFLLDGDWSLIFYAKFGKKIRKFALFTYIFPIC
jgi:hypothetical protein